MSDKTLVERLREPTDDWTVSAVVAEEAAALIEQLTAKPPSRDWRETILTHTEMCDLIDELTASRDRHERDVDVWRQRYIEKCAEVERLQAEKSPPIHPESVLGRMLATHCHVCGAARQPSGRYVHNDGCSAV